MGADREPTESADLLRQPLHRVLCERRAVEGLQSLVDAAHAGAAAAGEDEAGDVRPGDCRDRSHRQPPM